MAVIVMTISILEGHSSIASLFKCDISYLWHIVWSLFICGASCFWCCDLACIYWLLLTCLTTLCPGVPRWAGTRKVKLVWIYWSKR